MTEHPTHKPLVEDVVDVDLELLEADVATQPEDDDPLSLAGDPAVAPEDSGRPEDVVP